jgi:AraC-like DNA-binding protein
MIVACSCFTTRWSRALFSGAADKDMLEAAARLGRRLMIDDDETAERSSFRVGYRSASQFSREYVECSAYRHDATQRKCDA